MDDPRILFVCLEFPDFIEHVQAITGSDKTELNESIDKFVHEIINAKVQINVVHGELQVPNLMETYKGDFGGND
jgi:hypothetical protein